MIACLLSQLTISWFSPVLKKGWRKTLETSDLLPLPHPLVCEFAYHAFLRGLSALREPPQAKATQDPGNRHLQNHNSTNTDDGATSDTDGASPCTRQLKPSVPPPLPPSPEQHLHNSRALLRLIWLLHGPSLRRALLLIYGYQIFVFFQPLLLHELTSQLAQGRRGDARIWILPALLFLCPLLGSLCKAQAQLTMIRIQIGLRSQLTAAVYRKCLRLSAGARASMPSGRVVNLMSADVAKICDFLYPQLTFISAAPLAVSVAFVLLWLQIGWATLVGLAVLLLSAPVSNMAVRATQRHRNEMLKAADVRMKLVGQFLAGVRVIKMYVWEGPQARHIEGWRADELRALRNMIPSKVAMQTLLYVLPQLAGVFSFLAVGLTNPQALTAARAFSSLVLFQIMRFPLLTLSTGLVELGAAIISARRITAFMAAEEQVDYVTRITQPSGTAPLGPLLHQHRTTAANLVGRRARRFSCSSAADPTPPVKGAQSMQPNESDLELVQRSAVSVSAAEALGDKTDTGGVDPAAILSASKTTSSSSKRLLVYDEGSPAVARSGMIRSQSEGGYLDCKGGQGQPGGGTGVMSGLGTPHPTGSTGTPLTSRSGCLLAGVEPGLRVRARGFRWAVAAVAEGQEANQGGGKGGHGGGGGAGRRGWQRGRDGKQRPFMEVVDAAGEALVNNAGALRACLTSAFHIKRRGHLDNTLTAGPSAAGTDGDGPTSGQMRTRSRMQDDERVRLLRSHAGPNLYHSSTAGEGGEGEKESTAECMMGSSAVKAQGDGMGLPSGAVIGGEQVVITFSSESCGSGSGTDETAPGVKQRSMVGHGGVGGDGGDDNLAAAPVQGPDEGNDADAEGVGLLRPFRLGEVDLRVEPGQLVCVVGRVGSGKSSLLSAALGEMEAELEEGDVVGLGGRVAYVAQQAWILNATLLENVTMGKPLDEGKWLRCVKASALAPDLDLLPAGRDTEIGEKGLNLSGGQKQRLSLARAMYQEADIYLLDDPLSAVDVHVGSHIFNIMIRKELANAAVLLVTNAVQYLPAADNIVVMDGGEVIIQGSYQACLGEPLFRSLLEEFRAEQQKEEEQSGDEAAGSEGATSGGAGDVGGEGGGGGGDHHHDLVVRDGAHEGRHVSGHQCPTGHPLGEARGQEQCLPSTSQRVSTSAYRARRASVELARRQREDAAAAGTTAHMTDLDEGNEMVCSLWRMSDDGGGGGDDGDGDGSGAGGSGEVAHRDEERRPLLMQSSAPSTASQSKPAVALTVVGRSAGGGGGSGSGYTRVSVGERAVVSPSVVGQEGRPLRKPEEPSFPSVAAAAAGGPVEVLASESETKRGRITVVEDRQLGQVKWRVYGTYLHAFHPIAAIAMVCFWSAEQGTRLGTNALLAHWSRSQQQAAAGASGGGGGGGGMSGFAIVYLLLAAAYALATFLRSATNNLGSYRASKIIHARTLAALVAAPLSFFEATPVGRILNRLSRDVDEMDYNLAMYQQQLGNCVMRLVATIIFLCVLQPAFIGVIVPLMIIYFRLQKYFRRSSIELQRIDSVTRSPVYANFSETMSGLDTLRAYRMQERFKSRHESMVDTNATAYYNARVADEWLSLRLDLMGSIIVFSIAALNVALRSGPGTSPGLVALALAEAIDLTSFLNYAVKVSALVESRYNAVERLLVYAQLQPEESPEAATRGSSPLRPAGRPAWPATGELQFCDVWMAYRPGLDPVLKGVSFKILDGQKVGIVGRTGSGKSSLIVALFRLVEPQSGQMLLDGVDLRSLALGRARTALSAIPQEPVLFSGTVRSNLDPWDRHSDPQLWEALGVVHLKDYVRSLDGLSAAVAEGGANFSVGQRQLVCVARALLRQPRLLVADEATASVDPETDGLIQRALRTHFKSATVLAIAHRLNTILDSDAVLLMDSGRVGEFGTISELLGTRGSVFATMVRDAGLLDAVSAAPGVVAR